MTTTPETDDQPAPRSIVVVDLETTGFDPTVHSIVEVAWWNLTTGENGCFVPKHCRATALANASVEALRVNRYIDRLADAHQTWPSHHPAVTFREQLCGATLAGSTPSFDASFLIHTDTNRGNPYSPCSSDPRWHHRLLDLSNVAATALGLPFDELPGLAKVCELLDVQLRDAHTAAGDVQATGECFLKLMQRGRPAS